MPNVDQIIEDLIKGAQRAGARVQLHDEKEAREVKLANLDAIMGGLGHGGGMGGGMPGAPPPSPMGGGMSGIPPEILALLEQLCGQMGGGHESPMPHGGGEGGPPSPFGGEDAPPFSVKHKTKIEHKPDEKGDDEKSEKKEEKGDDKKSEKKEEKEAALGHAWLSGARAAEQRYKVAFLGALAPMVGSVLGPAAARAGLSRLGARVGTGLGGNLFDAAASTAGGMLGSRLGGQG